MRAAAYHDCKKDGGMMNECYKGVVSGGCMVGAVYIALVVALCSNMAEAWQHHGIEVCGDSGLWRQRTVETEVCGDSSVMEDVVEDAVIGIIVGQGT